MSKRLRLPINLQLFAEEDPPPQDDQPPAEPKTYTQEEVDALNAALNSKIADLTKTVKWQTLDKLGLSRAEIEFAIEHIDADNERDILAAISEFGDDLPVMMRVKQLQQQKTYATDPREHPFTGTPGENHPAMRAYRNPPDLNKVGRDLFDRLRSSGKLRRYRK